MKKIQPPAALAEQAEQLIREGRMPAIEQLLDAVDDVRVKYSGRIHEARRNPPAASYLEFFRNLTPADVERLKLEMGRARKQ